MNLLRDKVDIGSMQFGFMPGKGTTDAIFVVHQVQERFMDKKDLSFLLLWISRKHLIIEFLVLFWNGL